MLIAWDVEGTLNTVMQEFAVEHPAASRDLDALDAYRRRCFRDAAISVRPELCSWFASSSLAAASVHVAMTATPREFVPELARWTMASFGRYLSGVLALPSPRPGDEGTRPYADKGAFCAALGVDVLVDDELKNCESAARAGVGAVQLPLGPVKASDLDDALRRAASDPKALVALGTR